jgi:RNA polymerase sigma-70 factor (ECF subfamily)
MTDPDPCARLDPTDDSARSSARLAADVYDGLHRLAQQYMAKERPSHVLQPTALVHEAYLRIASDRGEGWASRAQYYVAAAEAMRRILIEAARSRGQLRRSGNWRRITLNGIDLGDDAELGEVLAVDEALEALAMADPRAAEVVRLRFYAGLSEEETAALLGLSERSVRRDWVYARAWLFEKLSATG